MEGILTDPGPLVLIDQLGDSTVNLVLFGWIDQRQASFLKVRSEAIRRIKERFDAEEVSMPEPTYRVQWTGSERPVPREERASGPRPVLAAGRPSAAPEGDIAPETHLDEEIAQERAREEDLLSSDGRTE
jgi:small-conductance mechanosensitive channel